MRYKVNTSCKQCGRSFSYWSDDPESLRACPNLLDGTHRRPAPKVVQRKRCPDTWDQGNDYS